MEEGDESRADHDDFHRRVFSTGGPYCDLDDDSGLPQNRHQQRLPLGQPGNIFEGRTPLVVGPPPRTGVVRLILAQFVLGVNRLKRWVLDLLGERIAVH